MVYKNSHIPHRLQPSSVAVGPVQLHLHILLLPGIREYVEDEELGLQSGGGVGARVQVLLDLREPAHHLVVRLHATASHIPGPVSAMIRTLNGS